MWLSDTSVKRPVLASVLSLLLLAFGLLSFDRLPLREYPDVDSPIVSIRTDYIGASAAVVETRVTQVIENRIAGIEGIKTINSQSLDGTSSISIEFNLSRDIDNAANDVRDRVSRVLDELPEEADPPEVSKTDADEQAIMWLNLVSNERSILELTDYAERYLVDRFSSIDGVARIWVSGGKQYAMRIWLDRRALAARQLTVQDIETALREHNIELPAGRVRSQQRDFIVRVERSYISAEQFADLVIQRGDNGYLVRLKDVAEVKLEAEEQRVMFRGNTVSMVGLGIIKQSTANTLTVLDAVKKERDRIRQSLPQSIELKQSFDSSVFIKGAIDEVYKTLFIAATLVVLVIYLFLGNVRAMLIPAVTLPISLVATFTVLYALGYSLNLLTLLAMVLAIGLVVDDAIVVLENIHRRMTLGETPLVAAYRGARQVGFAVIATTLVLIAVFVPITFLEGSIGRIFAEFAVTMATAVFFSSLVALSLSPVLCSKLLRQDTLSRSDQHRFERILNKLQASYAQTLRSGLQKPLRIWLLFIGTLVLCGYLLQKIPSEYAPQEDRGIIFILVTAPEGSSFNYTRDQLLKIEQQLMPLVEAGEVKRLLLRAPNLFGGAEAFNTGAGIMVLEHWDTGRRSSWAMMADIQQRIAGFAGIQAFPIMPQALGGHFGKPVQFVLGGGNYDQLAEWRDRVMDEARKHPHLDALDSDYRETKPQLRVSINLNRAGDLGVDILNISRTLETLLGSRRVTTFLMGGEEYDVIVEGKPEDQHTPHDISNIYVRSDTTGQLIPLANLVEFKEHADASTLNRYNRLRAITIQAVVTPGYSLGEALTDLENITAKVAPEAQIDYKGESLELKTTGSSVLFIFALALLVVFLVLAAQFESFVHPFVILLTVPLAVAGALVSLFLADQSLNIYSQIGLIMLVGLAAKNGILIVEFTNQLRDKGLNLDDALMQATQVRLRPILMTALTTVMGAIPLVLASGAGSEARFAIGVVVMGGVTLATAFTLIVVPVAYQLLAKNTSSPNAVSQQLQLEGEEFKAQ